MFNWCYKHRLIINSDKSQIMHFRNSRNSRTNKVFRLGEVEIKIIEKYKYLGIILDEYLNYNITAETLCSSASRALGALHSKTRNLKNCTYHTYSHLFSSGICPILHYSSSIWGYKQFLKCQNVQNKAMRHFLGLNKFSPNLMLIGDMAWTPSHILIKINMIKLWNKICNLNVTRLPISVLKWELGLGINNWSNDIDNILSSINIDKNTANMTSIDINEVTERLLLEEEQSWRIEVQNKPKLRSYMTFKSNISVENYVTQCKSKHIRNLIAQFRAGIYPLQIEIGRYRHIPLENRLCSLCCLNKIEDEFHVVCICPKYSKERTKLFDLIKCIDITFDNKPIELKFLDIMNKYQKFLGPFLQMLVKIRLNYLYN